MDSRTRIIFLFLLVPFFPGLFAQSGAFTPSNADYSWPRSTMKAADTSMVRLFLESNPEIFNVFHRLYWGAWNHGYSPFNNDSKRRMGAHIAKNSAFCAFLGIRPHYPDSIVPMTANDRDSMIRKSILYMESMVTTVEAFPSSDNYIFRSNELIDNLVAYDLLKGTGVQDSMLTDSKNLLIEYTGNLFHESTVSILGISFFSVHMNNHSLRVGAALAIGGIILNDVNESNADHQAAKWFHTGMYHIDNVLWRSSNSQSQKGVLSGYAEGPHYFRYSLKHVLPFFKALKQFLPDTTLGLQVPGGTRQIRHPSHDPDYDLLWEWITRLRMPNGMMPPLEDSFVDNPLPELAILQKPQYNWDIDFSSFRDEWSLNWEQQLTYSTDDLRAEYIAAATPMLADTFPHFWANAESGDVVFRSGWDSASVYLHISAENGPMRENAKGHNQGDGSSFLYMVNGRTVALDPGYIQWSYRAQVAGPEQHNLILVDGQGPPSGASLSGGDADIFIRHATAMPSVAMCETKTNYGASDISRRWSFMHNRFFFLSDRCSSIGAHNFAWRLHGSGLINGDSITGICLMDSLNQISTWTRDSVSLLAVTETASGNCLYHSESNVHELAYLVTELHTTADAKDSGTAVTFLSLLFGGNGDSLQSIQKLSVPGMACIKVEDNGYREIAAATADPGRSSNLTSTQTGLAGDLDFHGTQLVWQENLNGNFLYMNTWENDEIFQSGNPFFTASHSLTFAFAFRDNDTWLGYCGDSGTIRIRVPFQPQSVNGWGVLNWSYDTFAGMVEITFWKDAAFSIHRNFVTGAVAEIHSSGILPYPNPFSGDLLQIQNRYFNSGEILLLRMFNAEGRMIFQSEEVSSREIEIYLVNVVPGVYSISIENRNGKKAWAKVIRN